MVNFNSYVCLPEGKWYDLLQEPPGLSWLWELTFRLSCTIGATRLILTLEYPQKNTQFTLGMVTFCNKEQRHTIDYKSICIYLYSLFDLHKSPKWSILLWYLGFGASLFTNTHQFTPDRVIPLGVPAYAGSCCSRVLAKSTRDLPRESLVAGEVPKNIKKPSILLSTWNMFERQEVSILISTIHSVGFYLRRPWYLKYIRIVKWEHCKPITAHAFWMAAGA